MIRSRSSLSGASASAGTVVVVVAAPPDDLVAWAGTGEGADPAATATAPPAGRAPAASSSARLTPESEAPSVAGSRPAPRAVPRRTGAGGADQVRFVDGAGAGVEGPAGEQFAAAPHEVRGEADGEVDEERGQEEQGRVARQPRLLDHTVGDAAEDADRREAAGTGPVDDQQAHHERVDLVPPREAQADRGDDRHRRRDHGPDRGEAGGHQEHDPRDQPDPAPDQSDRGLDEPVDRAVGLRDGEQVRDADEDDEQIARETGEDGIGLLAEVLPVEDRDADDEGGDDRERAEVHRSDRGYHEDEG
nr:hypothetical protein [Micromonospora sp. ATA51]